MSTQRMGVKRSKLVRPDHRVGTCRLPTAVVRHALPQELRVLNTKISSRDSGIGQVPILVPAITPMRHLAGSPECRGAWIVCRRGCRRHPQPKRPILLRVIGALLTGPEVKSRFPVSVESVFRLRRIEQDHHPTRCQRRHYPTQGCCPV